jgi:hypothetical protein
MARVTKILFQAIWATLALPCAYVVVRLAWSLVSGHVPSMPMSPLPIFSGICLLLFSLLICAGVVYVGYRAVFDFSPSVVELTVNLIMLVVMLFALAWNQKHIMPLVTHQIKHPTSPALSFDLVLCFSPILIIWGTMRITRLIAQAINKLIFLKPANLPAA